MAYVCDNCGKGSDKGHNVSHAKNRTLRTRKPNLHKVWVLKNGQKVRATLCTKCLRSADRPKRVVKTKDEKSESAE